MRSSRVNVHATILSSFLPVERSTRRFPPSVLSEATQEFSFFFLVLFFWLLLFWILRRVFCEMKLPAPRGLIYRKMYGDSSPFSSLYSLLLLSARTLYAFLRVYTSMFTLSPFHFSFFLSLSFAFFRARSTRLCLKSHSHRCSD